MFKNLIQNKDIKSTNKYYEKKGLLDEKLNTNTVLFKEDLDSELRLNSKFIIENDRLMKLDRIIREIETDEYLRETSKSTAFKLTLNRSKYYQFFSKVFLPNHVKVSSSENLANVPYIL